MNISGWKEGAGAARAALAGIRVGVRDDDTAVERRHAFAMWSAVAEPGDRLAGELVAALGPDVALRMVREGVGSVDASVVAARGIEAGDWRKARARWLPRLEPALLDDALRSAARSRVRLLTPDDDDWPARMADLGPHAPLALWARGDVDLFNAPTTVAIVGARAATSYGEHVAGIFAAELAGTGVPVVSGGAYGIDGCAHRAALTAGGTTIALLAGGCDRAYPAGHTRLLDDIARHGLVASEVPCGATPTKWRFLQRNRLIAALGDATVVVEAGWRSGSLNTANHASSIGRPVGAVPGPVTSATSAGCHRLLRDTDARCTTDTSDVRELLGLGNGHRAGCDAERTDDSTRVVDALSTRSGRSVSDIARRSGIAVEDVVAHLGLLGLDGRATQGEEGWRLSISR